jgi:preprotein translocase subunit Sec61beta
LFFALGPALASVEAFFNRPPVAAAMAQKTKGPGIQSAAGLIRYYDDEEESSFKLPPSVVLIVAAVIGAAVVAMKVFWIL